MKRAIIIISALILSISLGVAQNIQQAQQQQNINIQQQRYEQAISSARSSYAQRQFARAIRYYETAREIRPESATRINDRIRHIRTRIADQERDEVQRLQDYRDAVASAQRYTEAREYAMALHHYHRAREIKPENAAQINTRIEYINERIDRQRGEREREQHERQFREEITSAQVNYAQRNFEQAIRHYRRAIELKPENAVEISTRIAAVTERMNEPAQLRIYRPRPPLPQRPISTLVRFDILLGNTIVAQRISHNWGTTVPVTTFGTQTLSATIDGRRAELQINIQPGGVYYVRAGFSSQQRDTGNTREVRQRDGSTRREAVTETIHTPTLQLVDSSIGSAEFNAIRR